MSVPDHHEVAVAISERVVARREELGLTQAQVAALAGIAPSAYAGYESGVRVPHTRYVMALAEALGMPVCVLLLGAPCKGGETHDDRQQ